MVSLDNIVRSFLIGRGQNTLHGYLRFLKYAIDILREIALHYSVMNKTRKCRMDQKKSIPFPDDCLSVIGVAWIDGDRLTFYTHDSSVATAHSYVDGTVSATANDMFRSITLTNCQADGYCCDLEASYGVGYNTSGYYNINHQSREVQFSSEVDSTKDIYLFYRSNGFNPKSRSTVSEVFQPLCEAYIYFREAQRKHGKASPEAMAAEADVTKAQNKVLEVLMPISVDTILGARARSMQFNRIQS